MPAGLVPCVIATATATAALLAAAFATSPLGVVRGRAAAVAASSFKAIASKAFFLCLVYVVPQSAKKRAIRVRADAVPIVPEEINRHSSRHHPTRLNIIPLNTSS